MTNNPVPKCGTSDKRNTEYEKNYSSKLFFDNLLPTESPIIFDVGAHKGESILFFKNIYPSAQIYSFEPELTNFEELLKVAKRNNTLAFNLAIAETDGEIPFFKQDISHLGGLLPINKESSDSLGYAKSAKNEPLIVNAISLDSFCQQNNIDYINLLKIDVQGYEVGVLKGALHILKNVDCCTVEVSLYDFYQNNSSPFLEIERLMTESGFNIWDFSKISKNPKNLRTDWVEVVYKKNK